MVLVAVLMVVALVAIVAAGLMFRMRSEVSAASANVRGEQAYEAATSGVTRVLAVLRAAPSDPTLWYDNPEIFLNQLVADDGVNRWYFTVYADAVDVQAQQPRYGPIDEAAKINLNAAPAETLLALPNMTTELVDCLLDYRDPDSETRPEGAEQDYYDQLETPYAIANGPLTSLDELFFVKGFNARIVYGEDANFNGLLDPNEDDGDEAFPPDERDGRLDRGLRALATVVSWEPNVDSTGKPRTNINGDPAAVAKAGLPQPVADFVRLYREDGGTFKHPVELLEMRYQLKKQPKDMPGLKPGSWIESKVTGAELPLVLDKLTAEPDPKKRLVGLVNVNTVPLEVLAVLPGLDANLAQQIVDGRRDLDAETRSSAAWLYAQNLLDAAAFKAVAPFLTTRSFQYSVRCVGFGVPCGRFRVVEAMVDLAGPQPRITYLRDISRLGMPFPVDVDTMVRSAQ